MPQCAAVGLQTLSNSLASRKQHGHRVLATAPLLALPRQPGRQLRTGLTCSLRPQQQEAVVQQREAEERASEPLPSVQAPQQQQGQLEHAAAERWMPASWLSGWKGAGSLLLSFGAVTGGGLMGTGFDISGPASTLQAVGVLGVTVGIHELGHFLAAVTRGIHVTKFSIGFGPTLLKWQGKEVEYSLRLLPLGGFVAFPDDDPESPYPADDPNLLRNRSLADRAAVISAGVAANMALALAICIAQAGVVGVSEPVYKPGVKLGDIKETTVAGRAGLRRGDVILAVDGQLVAPRPGSVSTVVNAIKDNPGRELLLEVERSGERLEVRVTPAPSGPDGSGRIGIQLAANADVVQRRGEGPAQALGLALEQYVTLTNTVLKGLWQFITNFSGTVENVSGPVAILAAGAEVARTSSSGLYQFAALVNINLAVVNILPLPALDGGYLVFIALEALRGGKKVDEAVEKGIMAGGFLLLMTAGVSLIIKDTLSLTGLGSMLQ